MQPRFEIADLLSRLGSGIDKLGLNVWQLRTLSAIKNCRTAALGGHIDACDGCGNLSISYNSCRNRHCPKCQGKNREDWIAKREEELLPVPYFHVVFTLPEAINHLCMHSPKAVYDILFKASWATLKIFGKNKDMQMGMIGLLHTWGQNLSLHPHLHCIVPGGGLSEAGDWQNSRKDGKFLFSVKAISKVFRAKFCEKLKQKMPIKYQKIRSGLWAKSWVVFAKRPFGISKSVVEYLGRYSHKIAISNHRIRNIDAQNVTFSYKDYRTGGQNKTMALSHEEFIRRFALHILPKGFVKIRHYGLLSSTWKRNKLKVLQASLGIKLAEKGEKVPFVRRCSCCKVGVLHTIAVFDNRGPPVWCIGASQNGFSCPAG